MLSSFFFAPLLLVSVEARAISSAWYTSWHAIDYPLSAVPWNKYTDLIYSFAEPSPDGSLTLPDDPGLLPQFVSAAHNHGVKALVAIGGWTGSLYFSDNVATEANRTAFVSTVLKFAKNYTLDGINFDWEYPGDQGIGCNTISPDDTSNFLAFLQELRADPFGSSLILSAATAISPFYDYTGNPSTDISAFSKVLDHINIMNYDIWGPWSATAGPNAPLKDSCAPEAAQQGSAEDAVKAWNTAGMPLNQIVLGVAAYGHSFAVNKSDAFVKGSANKIALYPPFNASATPVGDAWDDLPGVDICGNMNGAGGDIDFWALIDDGYLDHRGDVFQDVPYIYDTCTETPYVYNTTTDIMISFDNARSFIAKGKFISQKGLGGFAMWEAGGDKSDILLDAIRSGMSFV